jgi:hypothetical protein
VACEERDADHGHAGRDEGGLDASGHGVGWRRRRWGVNFGEASPEL